MDINRSHSGDGGAAAPDVKVTTSTGQDYIDRHTAVLAKAFATDPAITYMLSSLTPEKRTAYHPQYMHILLRASMLNKGIFVEAEDWSCAAVWMPPGERIDNELTILQAGLLGLLWNIGLKGCWRMMSEFSRQAEKIKRQFLVDATTGRKLKRFHYLWFIGTAEEARGRGLASRLIALRQEVARADGLPVWLEATTVKSREVYAKCGFRAVGEIKLGVGTHASTGLPEKGGGGLSVWAMIWRPEWEEDKVDDADQAAARAETDA